MSATSYGWLVLAFPLAGTLIIGSAGGCCRGSCPAGSRTAAIFLAFLAAIGALVDLQDHPEEDRQLVDSALDLRGHRATSTSTSRSWSTRCRCSCASSSRGVSFLIHLYSVAYMGERPRLRALLRLPQLLRLLDAAAGPRGELRDPDHRVGVRRRGVLPPDLVLVPPRHRRRAGIKAFVINVIGDVGLVIAAFLILDKVGLARLPAGLRAAPGNGSARTTARSWPPASCCSWARSRSRPSSRSTPGSRTPWRARPPSPR